MDEDNTSTTEVVETVETPEADPILATLTDTEVETDVETAVAEEAVEEAEPEAEQTVETNEEVEAEFDPKEEARRRYEERQAAREESQKRVQEVAQEHIKGAEDEYDQRLRTMEADNYARTVEHNENTLIGEFERAKVNPDLQIFNPDSEEFNQRVYDKAVRDYNAGYVNYDTNGNIVGLKGSLFEHLKETAELFKGAVNSGAIQQVRATKKMQSNADSKPAAQPKEQAKDNILDILTSD